MFENVALEVFKMFEFTRSGFLKRFAAALRVFIFGIVISSSII